MGGRLTKWEIGQDLISISDLMSEKINDLNIDTHSELIKKLENCQASIGDIFNEYNDHSFSIFDSDVLYAGTKNKDKK